MPGRTLRLATLALAAWAASALPALAAGQLVVKSMPRGATIYLDGRPVGATPLVLNVAPGPHRLQARLRGYAPQSAQVTAVDQLTTRATLALERLERGELRVLARPAGARIYVDGRFAGQAPLFLRGLKAGRHRVVAIRDGYETSVQIVEVVAGLTRTSTHALAAVPVRQAAPEPRKPAARAPVAPSAPQTARAARPERPAPPRIAKAFTAPPPVAPQPPAPESRAALPEPVLEAPVTSVAAPVAPPLRFDWPTLPPLPPLSPRELPFLAGMAALLGGLAYYFLRRWLPAGRPAPAMFPQRPARSWIAAPGPAFAASTAAWLAGDIAAARAALKVPIDAGTADAWHYHHLGLLAHREGKLAEAENAYRTALLLDAELKDTGYNLGVLLTDFDQAPQAILAYRKHLEVHPDDVDALFNLGHLYLALGMHQPASVHWTAARRLAPKDPEIRANLGFLLRLMRVERRIRKRAA